MGQMLTNIFHRHIPFKFSRHVGGGVGGERAA